MKLALVGVGDSVYQVENVGSEFQVAEPLFWSDCPDDCTPQTHVFNGSSFVLKPGDTPEQVIEKKTKEIKRKRDAVKGGGVFVSGKWFHTDSSSLIMYSGQRGLNGDMPANIQWLTMDGTTITRTPALVKSVLLAYDVLNTSAHANALAHISAMKLSLDPSNYDYSSGWPQTFI